MAGKVLVTGGAGFIGSHVVEYYSDNGYEVTAIDNLERNRMLGKDNSQNNVEFIKGLKNVKFVKGDTRNLKLITRLCKDADLIVHTAAQVAVTTSLLNPREDFEVNTVGTFNVLEAARLSNNDPAVVYCSTNKVYGNNVNEIPVIENKSRYEFGDKKYKKGIPESYSIDLCEHTPYGCSKLAADLYVQDYGHVYGLKTGVFRMSCIYGERQFGVEDQGWVAWFVIAAMNNRPVTIYGDGKQVRDVLYVKDLVRVYDAFVKSNLKQEIFNTGGGHENTLSLLELIGIIQGMTKKKIKFSYGEWRKSDQKVYISDISKARKKLGWKPEVAPEEGVKRLISWVKTSNPIV